MAEQGYPILTHNGYIKLERGYNIMTAVRKENISNAKLVLRLFKDIVRNHETEVVCVGEAETIDEILELYLRQMEIEAIRDGYVKTIPELMDYSARVRYQTAVGAAGEKTKES